MNKSEAQLQLISLQKEIDKLTKIINTPDNLFEKIKTYKDVCLELGEKEETCSYLKIKQIEKLFSQGWKKDWSNRFQCKYYPAFEITGSGWVYFYSDCYYSISNCGVAFYPDEKTSSFCGKTFIKEYTEFLNN